MRAVLFEGEAFKEYIEWATLDKKTFCRINELIKDIDRNLFDDKGKPEPLKHDYQGYWSRRITDEHRLIYKIADEKIYIVRCRGHYG